MDRNIFRRRFTKTKDPQWPCPHCRKSVLKIVKESFCVDEGGNSKEAHSHDAWDPDWISNRFSCLLRCSNSSCDEAVACVGFGSVEEDYGYDYDGQPTREYTEWFKPLFFHPHLVMMDIPADTPEEVTKELDKSFGVFYCDPSAAGNSARMAVEALLTNLGVKRYSNSGGTRRPIALHNRIDLLGSKYDGIKDELKAIKWIGNHGSHFGSEISGDTVIDAYDLLEVVLEELYGKKRQMAAKVAKAVNKRKGPRK